MLKSNYSSFEIAFKAEKLEYVRSVFEDLKRGDDETICLEEFKKQLSSLSVTEVGGFDS